jgi:hypothetical protein
LLSKQRTFRTVGPITVQVVFSGLIGSLVHGSPFSIRARTRIGRSLTRDCSVGTSHAAKAY